jgi:hypothetical protein
MGLFDSPKQTQSGTTVAEPWSKQAPYLQYGFDEASRLYQQQGPEYYTGSTVAGFSPEQLQAQQMAVARGMGGNDTVNMAEGYAQDVLGGQYLNNNPWEDSVYKNIESKVMPSVNSTFSNAGRYGSNSHGTNLTDQLVQSYAPYASNIYQSERGRMDNAMGFSPTFAQQDWTNIDAINNVGTQRQNLGQAELTDAVNRWNYYQNQPGLKLDEYMQRVMGNYGGTESSTSKSKTSGGGIGNTLLGLGGAVLGGLL